MRISQKIVILRKRKGWSQEELANELDVSRQSVYKWETDLAVPEINKIKKMVDIFGVSFDLLLDDNADIETGGAEVKDGEPKVSKKKKLKFRKVYISENKLNEKQADIEHSESYSLKLRKDVMKKDMMEYGADLCVNLQDDIAACFFHNSKNMTFGFYFNGAIQFICPVENYINHHFSSSSVNPALFYILYRSMVPFGRVPISSQPSRYDLTISYYNENGNVSEYVLSLYSFRDYFTKKYENIDGCTFAADKISIQTNKNLSDICLRLSIFPELSKRIHSGEIEVNNESVEKEQKIEHDKYSIAEKYEAMAKEEKRRRSAILRERQEFDENEKTEGKKSEEDIKKKEQIGCLVAIVIVIILFFLANS